MATRKAAKGKAAKSAARPATTARRTAPAGKAKAIAKPKQKPKTTSVSASSKAGATKSSGVDVGSRAPSFALKDQSGKEVASAELAGAPYVLYFYPKDDTTGCTKQACGFRDSFKGFGKLKARILGVSPDSEASHQRFAKKYGLPFTLLSDPDKTLAKAYGVWAKKLNYGREYMGIVRSTFVVDAKGTIQKAYRGVRVDGHVPAVLEAVQGIG